MPDPINRPIEDTVFGADETAFDPVAAADPETQTDEHAKALEAKRRSDSDILAGVMTSDDGQAFVMRILAFCNLYSANLVTGAPDLNAFNLGKRSVAVWLVKLIQTLDPELYAQLILSHVKRERSFHVAAS